MLAPRSHSTTFLQWLGLSDSLASEVARKPEFLLPALGFLRREVRKRQSSHGVRDRVPALIRVHASTIERVWDQLLKTSMLGSVYGVMLLHARGAYRKADHIQAEAILRSIERRGFRGGASELDTFLLPMLRAVLALHGGQHAIALPLLNRAQRSAEFAASTSASLRVLVHHLTGICLFRLGDRWLAMPQFEEALHIADGSGQADLKGHVLIDYALAQAGVARDELNQTLRELSGFIRDGMGTDRGPEQQKLLRERMCTFAGSGDVLLVRFLAEVGFGGLKNASGLSLSSFPEMHDESGVGPLIDSICAMLALMDQYVDITGISAVLFPNEEARGLGLSDRVFFDEGQTVGLLDDDRLIKEVLSFVLLAPKNPNVAEAALNAGSSFCMILRAVGRSSLAYYCNLCLDEIARLRGPSSAMRTQLALQRGFFLLTDKRAGSARICFNFALQQILGQGSPWRLEWAQAALGFALCEYIESRPLKATEMLWKAYVMSRISADSVAHAWRCSCALSMVLAKSDLDRRDGKLRQFASLLLDKLSIEQMLASMAADPELGLGKGGQWFPALRQAIATLVSLGRLAEAELVRDIAREADVARLTRSSGERVGRMPAVLSEQERRIWSEAGMETIELDVLRLRELVAANTVFSSTSDRRGAAPKRARSAAEREIATLWQTLPPRLDAALFAAAALLSSAEPDPTQRTESHAERLPFLEVGQASVGYLVQPNELITVLQTTAARYEHRRPIDLETLRRDVFGFRALCSDPASSLADVQRVAQQMYALLLLPIREQLDVEGIDSIAVTPHEFLDLVPFAALWDGTDFMTERFAWSIRHPSAGIGVLGLPPPRLDDGQSIELLGCAEFGVDEVALGGVERELNRIALDAGGRARKRLNAQMSAAALQSALSDSEVGIVHIATHASFDPFDESRSFLHMGDGTKVSVPDIRRQITRPLQMLVLAACSTAKNAPARDSIASAFLRAGARIVVATQWPVNDASSSWLMPLFYRELARNGGSAIRALQEAQCTFMRGDLSGQTWGGESPDTAVPDEQQRLHPRLWAPYTIFV